MAHALRTLSRDRRDDAVVFVFFLTIAALSTRFGMPLIDDVYITLRHSLNFARGDGLVYNPGERLLGASSPVYATFLAALVPIASNPVVPAIYVWPIALAVAAVLAYQLCGRGPLGILAGFVLCTDPGLPPIVGMETTFYVAILFATLALFDAGRLKATAFLLGVLPMVRPDGIFLTAGVVLAWLIDNRAALGRSFFVSHGRHVGLFLLPLVAWCLFATAYYGQPLPNSFVAKYYQSKLTWWFTDPLTFRFRFAERLDELRYRLLTGGAVVGAAAALFRKDRVLRAAGVFVVLYVTGYEVSRVPGYLNYFFPVFSMMTVLAGRGLGGVFAVVARRFGVDAAKPGWIRARIAATVSAAVASMIVVGRDPSRQLFSPVAPPDASMAYVKVADYLKGHVAKPASVAAMEIGIIGYYSGSRIVDFAGLVSPNVMPAIAAGQRRYALEAFHPDYVVARYPVPLALEGGLTAADLKGCYQFLYGADGVGVFRAVRPPPGVPWDVRADADRLNAYPGTVFIVKQNIDQGELEALDHAVEPHGSLVVRSLSGSDRDVSLKRYAYVAFREGHVDAVEPLMEASEIDAVSRLPAFDFDDPRDKFRKWNSVKSVGLDGSMLHITTARPDAYLSVPTEPFAPWLAGRVRIRVRVNEWSRCSNGGQEGALLWVTDRDGKWGARDKSVPLIVPTDGKWHELRVDLTARAAWNGSGIIKALRYDPLYCVAKLDLDYFRFE